ncbi:glycosyl transferase [Gloeocapsopsis crepidinum LEGE 06123]|uniref:Glycosyl transferase n=1 Tax=Gloeocapsopsis crepidinum LEGE 06123 TaxID=588587 RepID=A0ABR9UT01_9CHRO|nr:glycosyltransferase [Gloeocapsopsis crepidinum]MBE9190493.1 glycosyl transferase [Gloeocapsopsis crepidinum LEGE 06123]
MKNQEHVRVFIGSGEASLLERKTLIHSLHKHSQRELDIYVLNGTHNSITLNDGEPFLAPMSLKIKCRNATEFSLYRFIIPEVCNYQGKAIYVDSDIVCLTDIGKLFDTPMNGCDFLAKQGAYTGYRGGSNFWGLSVMLIDCEKSQFNLETIFDEIDRILYTQTDFMVMNQTFLAHHPYTIGELDPGWNMLDVCDKNTKLIHYTGLFSQPWKYHNHPYGEVWFNYFKEAVASGYITKEDISLSLHRAYVRKDLLKGNYSFLGREQNYIKQFVRSLKPLKTKKDIKPSLTTKSV